MKKPNRQASPGANAKLEPGTPDDDGAGLPVSAEGGGAPEEHQNGLKYPGELSGHSAGLHGSISASGSRLDPMMPTSWTVQNIHKETDNTVTLTLRPTDGGPVFDWLPGQFTMLYVLGIGEVPISISGDPAQTDVLVHTIRNVGAVTAALTKLKPGDHVGVRGPFGAPWPIREAAGQDILVVAGGLGLAPVRPIVYQVLQNRLEYGHFALLYGNRTNTDLLFYQELQQWRTNLDMELYVTVDRADLDWRGHVGLVTRLLPKPDFNPVDTVAFICGPEVMMRFTARHLEDMGVSAERIFLSMERNMQCAVGTCGHCQYGPSFICKDGPVFSLETLADRLGRKEF